MFIRVQLLAAVLLALVFLLAELSRRFPQVPWLQPFDEEWEAADRDRRSLRERRAAWQWGLELVALGLALPLGYTAVAVLFLDAFSVIGLAVCGIGAAFACTRGLAIMRRAAR